MKPSTIVIGAGPTGLSAAYHLGQDALLIEQYSSVGGWCRSIIDKGFTFDYAGHIMFSKEPYVHEMYRLLLGDNIHWQTREAWIYSKGCYTRYPFQNALYGLPSEVIQECIIGAIEAQHGRAKGLQFSPIEKRLNSDFRSNDSNIDLIGNDGKNKERDYYLQYARDVDRSCESGPSRNFEEFIYEVWGKGIAKHFAIPYNRKLWTVPLDQIETSWLAGRVPLPDLEGIIEGAFSPLSKPIGPNARFGYPLNGGFQALMEGFIPHLKCQTMLNTQVTKISTQTRKLTLNDRSTLQYENMISTLPLPILIHLIGEDAPLEVQEAATALRHISVKCVNLGIGREKLTDKHWVYYPEDTVFHRIFMQGNTSPHCNPPGGFGLTCEITYSPMKPLLLDGDALIQRCIEECINIGIFSQADPIWAANIIDIPYAYVIYDHQRKYNVEIIRSWLLRQDIVLAGRYSEWEYYNSDHAFIAGRNAARTIQTLRQERATKHMEDRAY
jgi:UDP-galactopyranose mutase